MHSTERGDVWWWTLVLFGSANIANAAWMLADPAGWYVDLPAAVPDTGPFNAHFVRDIGSAFAVMGVALLAAAARPALRVAALAAVSLFYVLHALVHVADTLAGRLPPSHWVIDAPGVYVPAVLMVLVTWAASRTAVRP